MIQNSASGPATMTTVDQWITKFKCNYDVLADPSMSFAPPTGGSIGLPYTIIVDPRTMKITNIFQGDTPAVDTAINSLIKKNGG